MSSSSFPIGAFNLHLQAACLPKPFVQNELSPQKKTTHTVQQAAATVLHQTEDPSLKPKALPKPVAAGWKIPVTDELIIPATPSKARKRKLALEDNNLEDNNFETDSPQAKVLSSTVAPKITYSSLYSALNRGVFIYKGDLYKAFSIGKGHYCTVYQLSRPKKDALLDISTLDMSLFGISIDELVVKTYHGEKDMGFSPKVLDPFLNCSLQNYADVVALGLPVAELLNANTAKEEMFFIQKRIPTQLDVFNLRHVQQAREFFTASVTHGVIMDLQPLNFRVTHDQKVVLIDFIEEPEDIKILISNACRAWVDICRTGDKEEGIEILKALTAGFLYTQEYTQEWFDDIINK